MQTPGSIKCTIHLEEFALPLILNVLIKGLNVNSYVTMLIDDRITDDPPGHTQYDDILSPLGLVGSDCS